MCVLALGFVVACLRLGCVECDGGSALCVWGVSFVVVALCHGFSCFVVCNFCFRDCSDVCIVWIRIAVVASLLVMASGFVSCVAL